MVDWNLNFLEASLKRWTFPTVWNLSEQFRVWRNFTSLCCFSELYLCKVCEPERIWHSWTHTLFIPSRIISGYVLIFMNHGKCRVWEPHLGSSLCTISINTVRRSSAWLRTRKIASTENSDWWRTAFSEERRDEWIAIKIKKDGCVFYERQTEAQRSVWWMSVDLNAAV